MEFNFQTFFFNYIICFFTFDLFFISLIPGAAFGIGAVVVLDSSR